PCLGNLRLIKLRAGGDLPTAAFAGLYCCRMSDRADCGLLSCSEFGDAKFRNSRIAIPGFPRMCESFHEATRNCKFGSSMVTVVFGGARRYDDTPGPITELAPTTVFPPSTVAFE